MRHDQDLAKGSSSMKLSEIFKQSPPIHFQMALAINTFVAFKRLRVQAKQSKVIEKMLERAFKSESSARLDTHAKTAEVDKSGFLFFFNLERKLRGMQTA